MMRLNGVFVLAGGIAFAAACGRNDNSGALDLRPNGACSAVAPIALSITVRDSISGRALADSASGSFRVAALTDTLLHADSVTLIGGRQVGSYDVAVQRPGYRAWSMSGISATKTTECGGVAPVLLTAKLQRLP